MKLFNTLPITMTFAQAVVSHTRDAPLQALVYRGPASCEGCSESVGALLESSPTKINVTYVGPKEDVDITAQTLSQADIYAHPGGGSLAPAWKHMKKYKALIQAFVHNGGRYLGFCLGAYLAGHDPGFDLLTPDDDADEEVTQPGAQVTDADEDTVIQVDWKFTTGPKKGLTEHKRWLYFQDGAVFDLAKRSKAHVLARYSNNGDTAAMLTSFGHGWVGLVGPHPEADESWYEDSEISNPDGIHFDIGHDFVETVITAGCERRHAQAGCHRPSSTRGWTL